MTRPFHNNALRLLRSVHGTSALAYLAQRGLDPNALLLGGYGRQFRLTIDASLAMMVKSPGIDDPVYEEWLSLRAPMARLTDASAKFELSPIFQMRLESWIAKTSPADVIDWVSPSAIEWEALDDPPDAPTPSGAEYSWLVERFTNTYLADWVDASLMLEYRYVIEDWKPSTLPSELLLERQVSPTKIRSELARRFVHGRGRDIEAIRVLTQRALEAIANGHRDVAAAVFSSARMLDPTDPLLANNHAFCLIPDHPAEALAIFAEARRLGGTNLILEANIATAYLFRGKWHSTLLACKAAVEIGLSRGTEAWLWSVNQGEQFSTVDVDVAVHLCNIALRAAAKDKDDSAWELWTSRLASLGGDGNSDTN